MINQERVKQLYKIALYEKNEEQQCEATGRFFKSDFIGKEIVKSIFSGTIAYGLMMVIWVICNLEEIERMFVELEIIEVAIDFGILYIGFLVAYLIITILVYHVRYKKGRKKLEEYIKNLKIVDKMYERNEKLNM